MFIIYTHSQPLPSKRGEGLVSSPSCHAYGERPFAVGVSGWDEGSGGVLYI